ncbi:hypothetical protein ABZ958_03170 [Streptomyces sp. NPDC046237]|uniref:hypothetical protein n=1 Tax=Streptomyces sp. NPDC046237 TaxID=3154914 RepID=UPI0033EFEE75
MSIHLTREQVTELLSTKQQSDGETPWSMLASDPPATIDEAEAVMCASRHEMNEAKRPLSLHEQWIWGASRTADSCSTYLLAEISRANAIYNHLLDLEEVAA